MPFPFSNVCDLLQQAADLPPRRRAQKAVISDVVRAWFLQHRQLVDEMLLQLLPQDDTKAASSSSAAALLCTILPELRPDRVYGLQNQGLQRIIARALGLGQSRQAELARWSRPAVNGVAVDLADCVEGILERTPNPPSVVTVEEIDAALHALAALCRFSSPAVRAANAGATATATARVGGDTALPQHPGLPLHATRDALLAPLYRRLDARGAKWFTRLVLKDFRPVVLDVVTTVRALHPALPLALRVNSDVEAALRSLTSNLADAAPTETTALPPEPTQPTPRLGIKVGRQMWAKARSIQHCVAMAGLQRMSCERKFDGEYVQVHVDLARGADACLQLFSKSGKDSTRDRQGLHGAIRKSLRIGEPHCPLKKGCILEGEMLAFDEKEGKILDFDAIRKHVTRSGSKIFSMPGEKQHEHLMIVYYDALLIDDDSLLPVPHAERFRRLQDLVVCRTGHAELVSREVLDFRQPHTAVPQLRRAFAQCIAARREGLVLKPDDDPYFDFSTPDSSAAASASTAHLKSYAIKLKKQYIGGFGEVGDFAIVGAHYDAVTAKQYPSDMPGLRWTHFYLGCLDDRRGRNTQTRPPSSSSSSGRPSSAMRRRFVITNVVTLSPPLMGTFLRYCRPRVVPAVTRADRRRKMKEQQRASSESTAAMQAAEDGGDNFEDGDDIDDVDRISTKTPPGLPFDLAPLEPALDGCRNDGPSEWFADPPVVDIRCFAFHRPGHGRFWSPRFPVATKVHFDRTYADAVTFTGLQNMAEMDAARRAAEEPGKDLDDDLGSDAGEEKYGAWEDDDDVDFNEEEQHWVEQLRRADPGGNAVDAETSQSSATVSFSSSTATTGGKTTRSASVSFPSLPTMPPKDVGKGPGIEASEAALRNAGRLGNVPVIDLTSDDGEEVQPATPRAQTPLLELPPLPPLVDLLSPTTPATPATRAARAARARTPTPFSPSSVFSSSPCAGLRSSSPVEPMSSLSTQLTIPSSQATGSSSSPTKGPYNTEDRPTDGRKRMATWDGWTTAVSKLFDIVSPPKLKRAKTGP